MCTRLRSLALLGARRGHQAVAVQKLFPCCSRSSVCSPGRVGRGPLVVVLLGFLPSLSSLTFRCVQRNCLSPLVVFERRLSALEFPSWASVASVRVWISHDVFLTALPGAQVPYSLAVFVAAYSKTLSGSWGVWVILIFVSSVSWIRIFFFLL